MVRVCPEAPGDEVLAISEYLWHVAPRILSFLPLRYLCPGRRELGYCPNQRISLSAV